MIRKKSIVREESGPFNPKARSSGGSPNHIATCMQVREESGIDYNMSNAFYTRNTTGVD